MKQTYWNIDRIMRLIIGLAIAAVVIWLVRYLSDVLLPFAVACLVAYILQPVVRFNQRWTHTKGRGLAAVLTIVETVLVIGTILYFCIPPVVKEAEMLISIVENIANGKQPIPRGFRPVVAFINEYINVYEIRRMLNSMHIDQILSKGSSILEAGIDVLLQILGWLLTIIYIFFILIDYPKITRGFKMIFPRKYRDRGMKVVRDVEQNMNHYFRGQGRVALCAVVFYCIGFSIVKLPLAIPMGILVGVLYMIPYFQYVTLIPVSLICIIYSLGGHVTFWSIFGGCLIVYAVSQSICDYIITPHVMGKEMGLNSAIILLSLSVWGSLLGIIGMIIALPVTALIISYYEQYISEPETKSQDNDTSDQDDGNTLPLS